MELKSGLKKEMEVVFGPPPLREIQLPLLPLPVSVKKMGWRFCICFFHPT